MNSRFIILLLIVMLAVPGCTVSFKAKELEMDSEPTTRVHNMTYELNEADFL